jgi:RNA polymerase sigma factor (sigma-70 family)
MLDREKNINWTNLLTRYTRDNGPDDRKNRQLKNLNREEGIQLGSEIVLLRSQIVDYATYNNLRLEQPERIDSGSAIWKLVALYRNKVNELAEGNLNLVKMALRRFGTLCEGDKQKEEQLFMAGVDGLMYAARRYNPWEGCNRERTVNNALSFSNYAMWCIRGSILGYLNEMEGEGSRGLGCELIRLKKDEEKYMQQLGSADIGEIGIALMYLEKRKGSESTSLDKAELLVSGNVNYLERKSFTRWRRSILDKQTRKQESGVRWRVNYRDKSGEWDSQTRDFEESIEYGLGTEGDLRPVENEMIKAEEEELIRKSLCNLSDTKEVQIIAILFGFKGEGMTLEAAAQEYGFTRERVRQIRDRGLAKIRRMVWGKGHYLEDIKS